MGGGVVSASLSFFTDCALRVNSVPQQTLIKTHLTAIDFSAISLPATCNLKADGCAVCRMFALVYTIFVQFVLDTCFKRQYFIDHLHHILPLPWSPWSLFGSPLSLSIFATAIALYHQRPSYPSITIAVGTRSSILPSFLGTTATVYRHFRFAHYCW